MPGTNKKHIFILLLIIISVLLAPLLTANIEAASSRDPVVKIGNITRLEGVRDNQLMGYGIVTGLAGSGDSMRSQSTVQSVANMLDDFGVQVSPDEVQSQNIAAVMVTADLPPFSNEGDNIDVTVSSIGDAESLQGGTLLRTPLRGADDRVYAVAQGPMSIGGYNIQAGDEEIRENHPTVGRVPDGALVEREIETNINNEELTYLLDQPDFEVASFIAQAINDQFTPPTEEKIAHAESAGKVNVEVPPEQQNDVVGFISQINNLEVRASMPAKIVINERTGTIVIGHEVKVSAAAVAHGNLTITITTEEEVHHPPPFSDGEEEVVEDVQVEVEEEQAHLQMVEGHEVEQLVSALNLIGATPRDIIAIIQQLKAAGAIHAEVELT